MYVYISLVQTTPSLCMLPSDLQDASSYATASVLDPHIHCLQVLYQHTSRMYDGLQA
jgi:hypothetical protein